MITLNNIYDKLALKKLAMWGSSNLGNDIYYLKEFIDMMINVIGEDKLVKMLQEDKSTNATRTNYLGNNWLKVKKKLKEFDEIVEKSKSAYDLLEDKTMKKKDKDLSVFNEKAKKIPMIKEDVYTLFIFLISNTSLNIRTIPSEFWKILEYKGSRLGEDKNKTVPKPEEVRS